MVLPEGEVTRYQAYIIYGKDVTDVLRRIANYVGGCQNLVADVELKQFLEEKVCREGGPVYVVFESYAKVNEVILSEGVGKGVIFPVPSPVEGVHAVAFIPINEFNKKVASGGERGRQT